jgi:hypothetical protein
LFELNIGSFRNGFLLQVQNGSREKGEFKELNFEYEGWATKDESRSRLHWLNAQAKSQNSHEIQNDMFA